MATKLASLILVGETLLVSGTTFTTRPTTIRILVELMGGGAGGGGVDGIASTASAASGGASGGYGCRVFHGVTPSTGYTYAIGAAGTGGAAGANPGNPGGDTTFTGPGALIVTAKGGRFGTGDQGSLTVRVKVGGEGVVGSLGTINVGGRAGHPSMVLSATIYRGGAGGSFPGWGRGGAALITAAVGNAGTGNGSGGSGATSVNATNRAGGAGTAGAILVTEYGLRG